MNYGFLVGGTLNSIRNLIIYTDCGGCDNIQIALRGDNGNETRRGDNRPDDVQSSRLLTANDSAKLRPGAFSQSFRVFAAREYRTIHTRTHPSTHLHTDDAPKVEQDTLDAPRIVRNNLWLW